MLQTFRNVWSNLTVRRIASALVILLAIAVAILFVPIISSFIISYLYGFIALSGILLFDKFLLHSKERDYDILYSVFVEKNVAAGLYFLGICMLIAVAIWRA